MSKNPKTANEKAALVLIANLSLDDLDEVQLLLSQGSDELSDLLAKHIFSLRPEKFCQGI
jgi:hypothetical protein